MFISSNYTGLLRNKNGFTILEILIAVFILAMVLSTTYAAYRSTLRVIHDSERDGEIYGMARSTMNRILKDLGAVATVDPKFKFLSKASEISGMDSMDLTFLSRSHLAWTEKDYSGALAEITYYVDEEGPEGTHRLLRQDLPRAGGTATDEVQRKGFVLCEGLYSLKYRFTDAAGQERDTWDSTAGVTGKNKAPAEVAIELKIVNPRDKEHPYTFVTRVFLPVTTAISAVP